MILMPLWRCFRRIVTVILSHPFLAQQVRPRTRDLPCKAELSAIGWRYVLLAVQIDEFRCRSWERAVRCRAR